MDYIRYKIGNGDSLDWYVYWETDDWGFHEEPPPGISIALDQVKQVFETIFGAGHVHIFRSLGVLYTHGDPQTFRENGIIFLSSADTYWMQYIYQFSHELCHFMIPNAPMPELRWFEESICELASLFTLTRIYETWSTTENPPSITGPDYTSRFPSYIERRQNKASSLQGLTVPAFITAHLRELEANCYLRAHNTAVANAMLPLFLDQPSLWMAVPHLCEISSYQGFPESLSTWRGLCSADITGAMDRLIALLTSP